MKKIKLISFFVFSIISSMSMAETISAWGGTVSEAEAKIANIAKEKNSSYEITTSRMGNYSYVTAKLTENRK
ncbi:DUF1471 domain-containing protein [Providencia manganoxydans]|uniref:DUF1471 domain-containing protein n=2 Tax=Providencia manganoxydans TaxID=2923283 RepID=A0ABX7AES5_9GAMM|nr:DUF1471 domain-containing protein [Providencia manganoxydans]HEF8771817.1 DUF1471 domain-containing protein [Providencia stuartii]